VTALISAFGAAPGTVVDRTLNNHPVGMLVAFLAAAASIGFALAAYVWNRHRLGLVQLSLAMFVIGIVLLVYLFTDSRIAKESPTARAALKSGGSALEVTAKAAGLTSDQQMFVYAYGLRVEEVDADGAPTRFARELLYTSQTGPDKGGAVDLTFEVPVPVGRYYSVGVAPSLDETRSLCSQDELRFQAVDTPPSDMAFGPPGERKPACLVIRIPAVSPRPQLFGTLKSTDGQTTDLSVRVKAATVGVGQTVLVRVRGIGKELGRPRALYTARLGPDGAGVVDGTIDLQVSDPRVAVICVEAAPLGLIVRPPRQDAEPGTLACPQRISSLSTVMRIPIQ